MLSTVWKGSLEFGLVTAAVRMVLAAKENKTEFHLVNPGTGNGVSQRWVDAVTKDPVQKADLLRATNVDSRTVTVTEEELAAISPEACSEIDLVEFVKLPSVDPLHFSGSYYLLPDGDAGDGAYHLVVAALADGRGFAALGTMVRLGRLHNVLIRASGGVLVLHTLYHAGEVRKPEELDPVHVDDEDLRLARTYVRNRLADWSPAQLVDRYREELLALIKRKREEIAGDLTSGLKASVLKAKASKKAKK